MLINLICSHSCSALRVSLTEPARSTARPTSGSRASRSTARCGAPERHESAGPGPPKGRDPRSQGQAVERALPALGFAGVQRPRGTADRARRRGSVTAARDVRAAARQPADRGLRDRPDRREGTAGVKFGVVASPAPVTRSTRSVPPRGWATP